MRRFRPRPRIGGTPSRIGFAAAFAAFAAVLASPLADSRGRSEAAEVSAEEPTATVALVRGSLDGPTARLSVRVQVRFEAGVSIPLASIDLPVTGSLVAAKLTTGGATRALGLLDAEQTAAQLEELAARVPAAQRAWAFALSSDGQANLDLSIAAPHAGTAMLELELRAPACFFRDARHVQLPRDWRAAVAPDLRAAGADTDAISTACGGDGDPDELWLSLPSPELAARPARPAGDGRIGVIAGRGTLDEDRHVARVELDAAGLLGDVPRDLATAIVVDSSRSLTTAQANAQRELVAAYLRAAPTGRIQVIAFARTARALLPGWTSARAAAAQIDRELRDFPPRNGSNLDDGLLEAGAWLSRIEGTRRVVLLTDERLAQRLDARAPASLKRYVPAGTRIHVVALDEGSEPPASDELGALAPLATATDGLALRTGLPSGGLDAMLLVRPVSLDELTIRAPGWRPLVLPRACETALAEGASCTWWGEGGPLAGAIEIEAAVWGRRVTRVVRPDPAAGNDVIRELARSSNLPDALQGAAELAARAVNPAWSLYAAWGGTGGYADFGGSGTVRALCAGPHTRAIGIGSIGVSHRIGTAPKLDLAPQLVPNIETCGLGPHSGTAAVEVTRSEIVDVSVELDDPSAIPPAAYHALVRCIEDAIWDTLLTVPDVHAHSSSRVTFGETP